MLMGHQLDPTMSSRLMTVNGVIESHSDYKSGLVEREFARVLEIRRE